MLYKTDKINNESNYEDKIIIKPVESMMGAYPYVIFVFLVMSIAFGYAYGFAIFIIYLLLTFYVAVVASAEYHKLVFDKSKIIFVFKDKEREFYWNDLETIRYEKYCRLIHNNDVIYFSKKKTKKPKWIDPGCLFTPINNSFYVELVDRNVYEGDVVSFSYPKYEFLDKLKEWGVKIEIDEKYLKKDPKLRKYVSNVDILIDEIDNANQSDNEWIIDNHIIRCDEHNNNYYISVDNKTIAIVGIDTVRRWGMEKSFKINNDKYKLTRNNGEFAIVKNGRYIHNNRRYLSKAVTWSVIGINIALLMSCLLMRLFNLFPNHIDMIILIISFISVISMGVFRFMKWGK